MSWVLITMPGITVVVQDAAGLGMPRPLPMSVTSTRHWRQAPAGSSSGWSQKRGIWMPSCSAARISSVPLGTEISMPSMVTVTRSVCFAGASVSTDVMVSELLPDAEAVPERARRCRSGRGTRPGST